MSDLRRRRRLVKDKQSAGLALLSEEHCKIPATMRNTELLPGDNTCAAAFSGEMPSSPAKVELCRRGDSTHLETLGLGAKAGLGREVPQ